MNWLREIILDSIESLLLLGIFQSLYDKENFILKNKLRAAIFCVSFIIGNYCSSFYISGIYHTAFLCILTILFITYIVKINIFAAAIVYSIFITIILSTEYLVLTIQMYMYKMDLNMVLSKNRYYLAFLVISKILQICLILLLYKFRKFIRKYMIFKKEGFIISNIVTQIAVFAILIFTVERSLADKINYRTNNIFLFLIYFVFLILKLKDIRDEEKNIEIQSRYKIHEDQIKNMEEIIQIIRQEKHDYANHINVIGGLCALNKPDSLKKINEYVMKISDNIHESFVFLDTGNDYLDGLLSIKKNYAARHNIVFDIEINESFELIDFKEDELVSIVSNLVDNAFDALKYKKDTESKEICIATFLRKDKFCIEIANNGEMIPDNAKDKIFEKGFSTKKKESENHGYGLFITKQLVEKNNGNISMESTEEETLFLVELNMKRGSL